MIQDMQYDRNKIGKKRALSYNLQFLLSRNCFLMGIYSLETKRFCVNFHELLCVPVLYLYLHVYEKFCKNCYYFILYNIVT